MLYMVEDLLLIFQAVAEVVAVQQYQVHQHQDLAVLVASGDAAQLAQVLHTMAGWPQTGSVSLLLAPDSQRTAHPSNTLEAQRRPLAELQANRPQLRVDAGTLMRWS